MLFLLPKQRIVAKLDALFSRIDEVIALTEGEPKSIQNLLPAALDEIFNGTKENFTWINLEDVVDKFEYGSSAKSKEEGIVPMSRMGNIQNGKYPKWEIRL